MSDHEARIEALETRLATLERSRRRWTSLAAVALVGMGLVAAAPPSRTIKARSVQAEEFVVIGAEGVEVAKLGLDFPPGEIRDDRSKLGALKRSPGLYFATDPVWTEVPLAVDDGTGATTQLYVYPPALDAEMAKGLRAMLAERAD